ncbi:hypothetical protein [Falsiroseomonas sp. HW251]|uniref:hypothetical protein n=1 Tax=Falsiroseomonas sp. HW251 TaxID=3390998 RepID=UPI003D31F1AA
MILTLVHRLLGRLRYRRRWGLAARTARQDAARAIHRHDSQAAPAGRPLAPATTPRRAA